MKNLARENKALKKTVRCLTKAYMEVIDLFLKASMEDLGLKYQPIIRKKSKK
jgi:hypothetical protein